MMLMEGLVIVSGLAIGYWMVSVFTRSPDESTGVDDKADGNPDAAAPAEPWHQVLGVSERAGDEEITAAYREKIGQYHPDKVATMGPEIRAIAEQKSRQINEAYRQAKRHH